MNEKTEITLSDRTVRDLLAVGVLASLSTTIEGGVSGHFSGRFDGVEGWIWKAVERIMKTRPR